MPSLSTSPSAKRGESGHSEGTPAASCIGTTRQQSTPSKSTASTVCRSGWAGAGRKYARALFIGSEYAQTAPGRMVPVSHTEFSDPSFYFTLSKRLSETAKPSAERVAANGGEFRGRTGVIHTPHGDIKTPAFTPVGTKATVKAVLPEAMKDLGSQALLSNAYHLYVQPGPDVLDAAGGLGKFMNWDGPTFTDSGGFQVMSLGSGFKKVIDMGTVANATGADGRPLGDDDVATGKERMAHVDDDGVFFKSHINGDIHRFTPEVSMQVQHKIGADVMFAFDELTTLYNSRAYQEEALERTRLWALRCIAEHQRLTEQRSHKPYQALFGVIQGAQYEDLRRKACQDLGDMPFDGFGLGGALEKENLGTIVRWCAEELPENKPRHLLGISEPDDIFVGIENGVDTFDCVSPTRVARNAAVYTPDGRFNLTNARYKTDFTPIFEGCDCYTCTHYTKAYIHHLFKADERLSATLASIHNERFIVKMVDDAREAIEDGTYFEYRDEFLRRYYAKKEAQLKAQEEAQARKAAKEAERAATAQARWEANAKAKAEAEARRAAEAKFQADADSLKISEVTDQSENEASA